MKTKVFVSERVEQFVKSLAPDPRRAMTRGLKRLAFDEGDIKLMEGNLAGYYRLRVKNMRVIYRVTSERGVRSIKCLFAGYRNEVYDLFGKLLADQLLD